MSQYKAGLSGIYIFNVFLNFYQHKPFFSKFIYFNNNLFLAIINKIALDCEKGKEEMRRGEVKKT